jgi:hypothetical protein
MKIEIEFTDTVEAKLTLDGKKFKVGYKHGRGWAVEGLSDQEQERTIGGIIASKLAEELPHILQAWLPETPNPQGDTWGTWETLPTDIADEMADNMRF